MRHTLYTSCPGGQYQKDTVCQVEAFLVYTQTIFKRFQTISNNPQTKHSNIPSPLKFTKEK